MSLFPDKLGFATQAIEGLREDIREGLCESLTRHRPCTARASAPSPHGSEKAVGTVPVGPKAQIPRVTQ
jgi:hypothetical protein